MCGFAGYAGGRRGPAEAAAIATAMAARLDSRGPDDAGVWSDPERPLAVGHRRLKIQDLSDAAQQPMVSADGRYVLAYNGEIYNATDLRPVLEARGVTVTRGGDTALLFALCHAFGPVEAARRAVGMFAFAWIDRDSGSLTLVRDRLGIKPLYWGRQGDLLAYASQPKAILAHPDWQGRLDAAGLGAFFLHGVARAEPSVLADLQQVPPGCALLFHGDGPPDCQRYWAPDGVFAQAPRADHADAAAELRALLTEAVRCRLVADVPIGVFLSGGIDSSIVASQLRSLDAGPMASFSVGFGAREYDEAPHAAAVARHLGLRHTALYLDAADLVAQRDRLPEVFDEPFADYSQLPVMALSQAARQQVTVVLTGDGGDEVFGGYTRHRLAAGVLPALWRCPAVLRRMAAAGLRLGSHLLAGDKRAARWAKMAEILPGTGAAESYLRLTQPGRSITGALSPALQQSAAADPGWAGDESDRPPALAMMAWDSSAYLPLDILTKVDRASMAYGLEARVPLLDHRLLEAAWRLPLSARLDRRQGKKILREILAAQVPPALTERPKAGFEPPLGAWLRGPWRDWAADLLDRPVLAASGVVDRGAVQRLWQAHLAGRPGLVHGLWILLVAEQWQRHWRLAL